MENSRIALIKSLVRRAETGVSPEYMEMARESRIFTDWAASLDPSFDVQGVTVTAVDFKGRNPSTESVMFVRLAVRTAGVPFDQVVELRGGTVVMLVVLRCEGVDYTVLVAQPRLPTGQARLKEVPAGMLDDGQFSGKAAQEIEEELGLVFAENELLDMTVFIYGDLNPELYFSPGLLDERARFFLARRKVTRAELTMLQGKSTGVGAEGEDIVLSVDLLSLMPTQVRDLKSIAAFWLYETVLAIEQRNAL